MSNAMRINSLLASSVDAPGRSASRERPSIQSLVNDSDVEPADEPPHHGHIIPPKPPPVGTHVSYKPYRYLNKPVWAQDWPGSMAQAAALAGKPTPMIDVTSSSTGAASINIPNPVLQAVQSWVMRILREHSNIIPEIEIELKVGTILEVDTRQRPNLPVSSDAVLDNSSRAFTFAPGIPASTHSAILSKLEGLTDDPKGGDLREVTTHVIDRMHNSKNPRLKSVRLTHDAKSDQVIEAVSKKRLDSLFIFRPLNALDFRISASWEIPAQAEDASGPPRKIRDKYRKSFINDGIIRYDWTKVTDETQESILEFEIEIDPSLLQTDPTRATATLIQRAQELPI
ncbi:hypothetical protein CANCADRAFT_31876 [Tortispora caseinolytica NRRL Y-17796]|uniref:mRNA-capping enzyme subunit beta n=1 Tax=Tortispora caseinolytica NRRL Y-17796 TaxID=767744 RepID=A0A1E4TH86_9ASCO|nr:hypothetical protein CANCADRAFT_31876 [Tortispora caseinolytica NRRL Y-17796]